METGEKGEIRRCDTDPLFYIYAHTPPAAAAAGATQRWYPAAAAAAAAASVNPTCREGGRGAIAHVHIFGRDRAVMTNEREHAINPTR